MGFNVEVDFITEAGLRAVVIATDMGHRCAYVAVTDKHPLHGMAYSDRIQGIDPATLAADKLGVIPLLIQALSSESGLSIDVLFNVHGSITYTGGGQYPVENDENLWWFGFDAGHADDARDPTLMDKETLPYFERIGLGAPANIRTCDYMMNECESLARQLVDFKMPGPLALEHQP